MRTYKISPEIAKDILEGIPEGFKSIEVQIDPNDPSSEYHIYGVSENGGRVSVDDGYGLATYRSALESAERQSAMENIVEMDNCVINDAQFEEINLNEDVKNVACLGTSSSHPGCTWYDVEFLDGTSIDVFTKNDPIEEGSDLCGEIEQEESGPKL